jgi:hypothetical protein
MMKTADEASGVIRLSNHQYICKGASKKKAGSFRRTISSVLRPAFERLVYTSDEIKDTWYSGADNSRFRKDIATTVRRIIHKLDQQDVDGRLQYSSSRGAECRMQQVLKRRHQLKWQAWSAVLDEQEFQREVVERNDDRIAAVYRHVSREAVREAFQLAANMMDRFDAYRYQNEQSCQHKDEFNDDWIRSIATQQDCTNANRPTKQLNFRDDAGFDDTWIRDVSDPRVGPLGNKNV